MTEVPEHLLQRSRDRRRALGLGGDDAPPADAPASAETPATVGGGDAPSGAPALVKTTPAPPSYTGPPKLPPRRNLIPMWVAPVLVSLPVWAFFYFGALGDRPVVGETDPLELGAEVYQSAGCGGCHGPAGEGGVGPELADGEAEETFPEEAAHIDWVTGGSIGGLKPYGNPEREGGQRLSRGGMPAFGGSLSPEEIEAVVAYEREGL